MIERVSNVIADSSRYQVIDADSYDGTFEYIDRQDNTHYKIIVKWGREDRIERVNRLAKDRAYIEQLPEVGGWIVVDAQGNSQVYARGSDDAAIARVRDEIGAARPSQGNDVFRVNGKTYIRVYSNAEVEAGLNQFVISGATAAADPVYIATEAEFAQLVSRGQINLVKGINPDSGLSEYHYKTIDGRDIQLPVWLLKRGIASLQGQARFDASNNTWYWHMK